MLRTEDKNLSSLKPGEVGTVEAISGQQRELKVKIQALGLVKGSEVKVLHVAPFGDPMTVEVRGSKLSLRKNEASIIKLT